MEVFDIVIIGSDLNGFSIAADAATRGYRVMLIDPADINNQNDIHLPLLASGFMPSRGFDPSLSLQNLNEQKILHRRAPSACQWLPVKKIMLDKADCTMTHHLSSLIYRRLYQWHQLPKPPDTYEGSKKLSHIECVVNTNKLIKANDILAQAHGAIIESQVTIENIEAKQNFWRIKWATRQGIKRTIETRSVINCTGRYALKHCKRWFGHDSRCQTRTQWHSYLSYRPNKAMHEIYYLPASHQSNLIYLPIDENTVIIGSPSKKKPSYQKGLETIQSLLRRYHLPEINEENITQHLSIPSVRLITDSLYSSRDYMIDFICPEGEHPIINIIGGNTIQCRLMAEQAINNLADYLPKSKDCQTKILPLL